jgi:cyclopropane fatty-acyl-phospholipid synthase-like methyltransferase
MSKLKERMIKDGHLGGYIAGGDPGTWCPSLWSWAIQRFGARSVLDVGCGEGHSAKFFLEKGCEVLGVEGCRPAIEKTAISGKVAHHDFTTGPFLPPGPFDLIWSCEFLEHVESCYVPNILATFAYAAKAILLTHAFTHQTDGFHHVNCQPTPYWIRRIEAVGFKCHVSFSLEARTVTLQDYAGINHFARSGLVFVRTDRRAERGLWDNIRLLSSARVKSWRINWGFRWSQAYRRQKRGRRLAKRQEKKAA